MRAATFVLAGATAATFVLAAAPGAIAGAYGWHQVQPLLTAPLYIECFAPAWYRQQQLQPKR